MRWITSKKPVAGKHKRLGSFSIPVEVPQAESLDEFITFTGGPEKALSYVNRALETGAKNGARAAARALGEEATKEDMAVDGKEYKRIRELAHDYTPQSGQERGISAKKGKEVANQLQQLVADPNKQSFTREELAALFEAAK